MNKFKFYFILLISTVSILSCSKNDDDYTPEPLRDYQEQYNTDISIIEDYLNTYYIDLSDPNYADKTPVILKITDTATQPSLMSYLNASTYPKLLYRMVALHGIEYKVYYLVLREGTKDTTTGLGGVSPCNVDGVFTAYKGSYLYRTAATTTSASEAVAYTFEQQDQPINFNLSSVIPGWGEVFPQFKTGSYKPHLISDNPPVSDGTIDYSDFGAGVMFIPSGLAYYNNVQASIPAYSPLVFSFKLYDILRLDQDNDGIPSYLEDLDNDRYIRTSIIGNPDDTDQDGIPDCYDVDDDGDKYTTQLEIKNLETGSAYPFDQIPISPTTGKKIYLDNTYHP